MNKLKYAVIASSFALATAGLLSAQAYAGDALVQGLQAMPVAAFSQSDVNGMFDQAGQSMEIAALSAVEMKETEGAWGAWGAGFDAIGVFPAIPLIVAFQAPAGRGLVRVLIRLHGLELVLLLGRLVSYVDLTPQSAVVQPWALRNAAVGNT